MALRSPGSVVIGRACSQRIVPAASIAHSRSSGRPQRASASRAPAATAVTSASVRAGVVGRLPVGDRAGPVDLVVVGGRGAVDQRLPQAGDGVDDGQVAAGAGRVGGEDDAGRARVHHLLDDEVHRARDPGVGLVGRGPVRAGRGHAAPYGGDELVVAR